MNNHAFPYYKICLDNWGKIRSVLRQFQEGWIFRGQSKATWPLAPALERANKGGLPTNVLELCLLNDFRRAAHQYLAPHNVPSDQISWLAMMQHHGAPTRLLDWTYSPYVALFFAIEEGGEPSIVWVIGLTRLKRSGERILMDQGLRTNPITALTSDDYHQAVLAVEGRGVFAIEPFHKSERLNIQQGLFLLGTDPNVSLERRAQ